LIVGYKKLNKPISVDEYIVTIWTGGQYPAAPPYIIYSLILI